MATKFKYKDRVALKSDIKHRGVVLNAYPANGYAGDDEMYTIQWDKHGEYLYVVNALIPEAEANKIQAEIDASKKIVDDKFKAMKALDKT